MKVIEDIFDSNYQTMADYDIAMHNVLNSKTNGLMGDEWTMVSQLTIDIHSLSLYRKQQQPEIPSVNIDVTSLNFEWVQDLKTTQEKEVKVWLTTSDEKSGAIGLLNCLQKEGLNQPIG